jgi:hypothetical protein
LDAPIFFSKKHFSDKYSGESFENIAI